jgi:Cu(I)/Ag(I) efflux system membrane protein CusA/SilA
VLVAFIPFGAMGITANIMSLGGIAIAMGELVDAAIVVVEQAHKRLEQAQREGSTRDAHEIVLDAVKEVAPASFYALLVIAVSFLPVLTLEAQEGRMFKPLAYTKTLTMLVAAVLVITLDPALRVLLTRVQRFEFRPAWLCRAVNAVAVGRIRSEESHPISRVLTRMYEPVVRWSLRWRWPVIGGAAALVIVHHPGVHAPGIGVHAAAPGGLAVLHADDDARHLDHRGAEAAAGKRPGDQAVPRGRPRARQGGARGIPAPIPRPFRCSRR